MSSRRALVGVVALVTVLTVAAGAVLAAQGNETAETDGRTITVVGSGDVSAEPDAAEVRLSVTAQGTDASSVSQELANGAAQLRETLSGAGVDEADVQTQGYSVHEDPRSRENPNRTVYRGEHVFTVTLDDVDRVGELIDVAVDGGADDVGGVHYTLSEQRRDQIRDDALNAAIDEARDEAGVVGNASGLSVGTVRHASTQSDDVQPYRAEADLAMDSGAAGTELDPQDVTVSATVEVTFDATPA